ncbi:MAG: hypothetical protein JO045_19130 [Mycobacterium sp.]|nr:hypothetical protein [Mycobacterium sp.]
MNPVQPGLRFNEKMTGLVNMGSTDPIEGYQNPGAVAMSLRAAVTIANLSAFFTDPNHRGQWSAEVAIPVWGGHIQSTDHGDFRLFQRAFGADGKPVREMVYDTSIAAGEHAYLMRGRKIIQPGPPWRFWPATTTLYVQFFELDRPEQVVAAGVLQLTPFGFLHQLSTMRITGDFPSSVKLRQLWLFVKLFAWSLVRTYILGRRW